MNLEKLTTLKRIFQIMIIVYTLKSMKFKVASYNVFGRWENGPTSGWEGQNERAAEIPEAINKKMSDVDVIVIQESWCGDEGHSLRGMGCASIQDDRTKMIKGFAKYGWI